MASKPGANSDEELVRYCQHGRGWALDELVARHAPRVYGLALRLSGSAEDAEDIAQEAFVKVLASIGKFRGQSSFNTWLYRVVTNACLDELKRRKRRPSSFSDLLDGDESTEPDWPMSDPDQDPAAVVETRARQAVVQQAIASLPEPQRVLVVLADIEGLSYEEIAQITSATLGTVKSRLNRARRALRALLSPHKELLGRD